MRVRVWAVERSRSRGLLLAPPCADGPVRPDNTRKRTYRTKEETDKSKSVTSTVVGSLLLIAVVVSRWVWA